MISLSKTILIILTELRSVAYIAAALILSACAPTAQFLAEKNSFTSKAIQADKFLLQTYQKVTDPSLPYVVYIEGDGLAFKNKQPSDDPTPIHPVMLQLAILDKRPNVVYIARPCQYLLQENGSVCNYHYWTDKRMSEDSVVSMNEAVMKVSRGRAVNIVGFSGGGSIAVLIAARNPSIASIITIAGNLDHKSFNEYHHVRPMTASLNAIDYASKVKDIPQLHLSGGQDAIVPAFISEKFVEAVHSKCAHREVITNATHLEGWAAVWPAITQRALVCDNKE